jgi:hypothetical protein
VRHGGQQHRLTAPHLHVPCCSSLVSFQRVQTSADPDSEVTLQIAFDVSNSVGSPVVQWPERSLIKVQLTPGSDQPLQAVSIYPAGPDTTTFECAVPCPAQFRRCRQMGSPDPALSRFATAEKEAKEENNNDEHVCQASAVLTT